MDRSVARGCGNLRRFAYRPIIGHMHRFDPTWPQHQLHVSPLGPTWCEAVAKGPPSCGKLELSWTRPNISPTRRNGANLGSSCVQDSATWAQVGPSCQPGPKLGPTRANFADSVWHAENWRLYRYVQCFLALMRVHFKAMSNFGASCPHMHAKLNLHPHVPKLRHVGPQLGSSCPSWS